MKQLLKRIAFLMTVGATLFSILNVAYFYQYGQYPYPDYLLKVSLLGLASAITLIPYNLGSSIIVWKNKYRIRRFLDLCENVLLIALILFIGGLLCSHYFLRIGVLLCAIALACETFCLLLLIIYMYTYLIKRFSKK